MTGMFRSFREKFGRRAEERVDWTVRKDYQLPRKVVVRSLEVLDSIDSPDRPGLMYMQTLEDMVMRFDEVFGNRTTPARQQARGAQVTVVMNHLQKHTRRRRGDQFVQEGVVEWEQTRKVYELFTVDLNLFERIYFTVDVSESTAILSKMCSCFLVFMIILSIVVWMVSTLPVANKVPPGCTSTEVNDCAPEPDAVFGAIEQFCVYVFTAEYLIRLFTVHSVRFPLLNETFLEGVLTGRPGVVGGDSQGSRSSSGSRTNNGMQSPADSTAENSRPNSDFSQVRMPNHSSAFQLPGKLHNTLKHVVGLANMIDLLAIMPYWIEVFSGSSESEGGALMVLRILRLTRIFRVFKLGKYNEVFTLFSRVISQSVPALSLMVFFISLGCCLFGTLIWFAEQGIWYPPGHPKLKELDVLDRGAYLRHTGSMDDVLEESPFYSIIHSFWYVIVTITTVGYGDIAPTTLGGKIIGALTILNGIIVLAMPIGVVGANFSQEYYRVQDEKKRRIKLKQQMKTRAQVEEEQDAALTKMTSPSSTIGTELCRQDLARKDIVIYAEDIDDKWQAVLPQVMYTQVSMSLKKFVRDITKTGECTANSTPVVPLTLLETLDVLTSRVHSAIAHATSTEDLAEFGLREARDARHQWAEFADRCWLYVVEQCHVEKAADPPEFYQMKANLARAPQPSLSRCSDSTTSPSRPLLGGADAASGKLELPVGEGGQGKARHGADESAGSSRSNPKPVKLPLQVDHRSLAEEPPGRATSRPEASLASGRPLEGLPGIVPCDVATNAAKVGSPEAD